MSEFSEFCKLWKQNFPNEEIPRQTLWEDDTRANLLRHQKNLEYLKSEVQKEEFYIKFLEKALSNAESRKLQASPNISETSASSSESNSSEPQTNTSSETPKRTSKSDFVTVITVNKRDDATQEQPKASADDRPKAPPKPFKQNYNRSVSSDSPVKSKSEDLVAWTKQQILQQLQTKQTSSKSDSSDLSVSPLTLNLEDVHSSPTHGSNKRRSYENVSKTRQSYENVFNNEVTIRYSIVLFFIYLFFI